MSVTAPADAMLIELDFAHAGLAEPLFAGASYDRVFADAFFAGQQPGRVFVEAEQPAAAMLCRTYEYFFAGEPAPAIRRFVRDAPDEAHLFAPYPDLATARTGAMVGFYGMVAFTPAWHDALLADHGGRLEAIGRRTFRLPPAAIAAARTRAADVPEGMRVVPLDAASARRVDAVLDELIGLLWSGYQRFGEHGLGAAVVAGDAIASVAYAIATSEREVNLGVGTAGAFQRRGLATLACRACIALAGERGLRPTWDCDDANPASANLALKLGFVEEAPFLELAFPGRAGPPRSTGLWRADPHPLGRLWRRTEPTA